MGFKDKKCETKITGVIKNKIFEKIIKLGIIGTGLNFEIQINLQTFSIL